MLDFDVEPVGPFICDSWQSGFGDWYAHNGGPWKPKAKLVDAVIHCIEWTGGFEGGGIPAMRVRDMATGEVVWQESERYPEATGERIRIANEDELRAMLRVKAGERAEAEREMMNGEWPQPDDDEDDDQ